MIFHDQEYISIGLRKLALNPKYRSHFNFYQMKNPPADRMRELKIDRLSKLITFLVNPVYLVEPDSTEPFDKVYYEMGFVYDKIKVYLDVMIQDHALYLKPIPEVTSHPKLDELCLHKKQAYCLLFVVDRQREERNENMVDRENDMIILHKHSTGKMAPAFFDFNCYPELRAVFGLDDKSLPAMLVYNKKKKSFFKSASRLNIYDGKLMIDRVLDNEYDEKRFVPVEFIIGINKCEYRRQQEEDDIDL